MMILTPEDCKKRILELVNTLLDEQRSLPSEERFKDLVITIPWQGLVTHEWIDVPIIIRRTTLSNTEKWNRAYNELGDFLIQWKKKHELTDFQFLAQLVEALRSDLLIHQKHERK